MTHAVQSESPPWPCERLEAVKTISKKEYLEVLKKGDVEVAWTSSQFKIHMQDRICRSWLDQKAAETPAKAADIQVIKAGLLRFRPVVESSDPIGDHDEDPLAYDLNYQQWLLYSTVEFWFPRGESKIKEILRTFNMRTKEDVQAYLMDPVKDHYLRASEASEKPKSNGGVSLSEWLHATCGLFDVYKHRPVRCFSVSLIDCYILIQSSLS